jgi:acetylornithine deacetylase/succinyl-diaminopimelate desuccinylase-like protein
VLRSPKLTASLATGQLLDNPLSRAVLTNTVNVTGFGGAEEPNVVPGRVWAQLDVRMLPGVTGKQMLAELNQLVAGVEGISFEVISETPALESPTDDPLFQTVVRRLQTEWPDAAVGPFIMMGTTDSQILRAKGVHCYGVAPFVASEQDLRGMHGDDERLHRDVLGRGVQVLLRIVLDAAAEG